MKNILFHYFKRLFKTPLFYIIISLMLAFSFLYIFAFGVTTMSPNFDFTTGADIKNVTDTTSRFSIYLNLISPFGFLILFYMFIIKFISVEWNSDTFRNKILSGKNRSLVFFSDFIFSLILYSAYILIITFMVYTFSFGFNFSSLEKDQGAKDVICSLIIVLLNGVSILSLVNLLCHSFHGYGAPLIIYIAYLFIQIVIAIVISEGPRYNFFTNKYINLSHVGEFFQLYQVQLTMNTTGTNIISSITRCLNTIDIYAFGINQDLTKGIAAQVVLLDGNTISVMVKTILTNLALLSLNLFSAMMVFKKRDLK